LAGSGQFASALVEFDEIVRRSPDYEAWLNRGVTLVNQKRYDEAIEDFTRALQLRPDSTDVLSNRAFAYVQSGRIERALADLDRAVELDPDAARLRILRGGVREALADRSGACRDWQRACELGDCRLFEQRCAGAAVRPR
jgi:tetratricopeptide (TPR) repeat protein